MANAVVALCNGINDGSDSATKELVGAIGEYPHYLSVLVDGLGINQQSVFPKNGFFDIHLSRTIRSVFPSTTATALTSFASGVWPANHAITGWFTHLPDKNTTVIPLRAVERFSEKPIGRFDVSFNDIMRVPSVYPALRRSVGIYTYKAFRTGPFADWYRGGIRVTGYRNLQTAVKRVYRGIAKLIRRETPSFNYLYLSEVDHLSHIHGPQGPIVTQVITGIDSALAKLRSLLPQSVRMIVTADHGHIEIPESRHEILSHNDPLLEYLDCPPSGEARVPLFHVKPGMESEFLNAFDHRFDLEFELITPDEAEALELYGPEPIHRVTRERLGSFIGISRGADAIEYVSEGREGVGHKGMHGGMSADEVEVPLFLA